MILSNAINAGNFIYCTTYLSPHESSTYHNSGNGHYHRFVYIIDGYSSVEIQKELSGEIIEYRNDNQAGTLIEHTHTKDMYQTIKTQDTGLSMIFFNPIPDTRNLKVSILKGAGQHTITADINRITIIAVTGPITVNDKPLLSLQHAKLFPGKTADIILPEHTICALVTEEE